MTLLFYLVSYDIPNDSLRTKTARLCENYGFQRIQFSVFAGEQTRNMVEMLILEISDLFAKRLGKVVVIPICFRCFEKISYIGMSDLTITKQKNAFGYKEEKVVIL